VSIKTRSSELSQEMILIWVLSRSERPAPGARLRTTGSTSSCLGGHWHNEHRCKPTPHHITGDVTMYYRSV